MATILSQLANAFHAAPQLPPATVQIKLGAPLPAASAPSSPATPEIPLTLTVVSTQPGGQTTLQLPGGNQIKAQVLPPPAPGSQITIPATAAKILSTGSEGTPVPTITARIQLPTTAAQAPQLPLPANPGAAPALLTETHALTNPGTALTQQLISAIKNTFSSQNISNTQNILPEGPLNLSFKQQINPHFFQTPITLTLTSPTTALLTNPGQPPQPLTLAEPSPLPLRTPLPLAVLPNPANPQQPVILLTQQVAVSSAPPSTPATPPLLSALKVLISASQPSPVPVNTPVAARVLPQPLPNQPFEGQALKLASGHTAVLQSPQPIPAESTLVVEFPTVTGPAQVTRVQPSGQQQSAQPQLPSQTPTPVAAQTNQPVLPAGTIVQGTLLSTTEQGQPLLTISQPPQLAGKTIPLTLPENLHNQIPLGTQLSVKIEASGAPASLLSISLPPAVQRAYTLTTLGGGWQTLQQALDALGTQAPAIAQSLKNNLPHLANLLPGLVAFTDALRKNDPEAAFGKETTTLLRAMGVNMASDVQHLSQLQQPQPDNAWRGTLFPYIENPQDNPRQGGFFWRREKKDDPRAATSTRFIMQLSLSQMGEVQLDGLINYPDVWLKLRRTTPAESGFIEGLQQLVNATLEAHGLSGGIAVEVSQSFPVNPLSEMLSATPNPIPTSA